MIEEVDEYNREWIIITTYNNKQCIVRTDELFHHFRKKGFKSIRLDVPPRRSKKNVC